MVVQGRVVRHQVDGAFQMLDRFLVLAKAVERPAEAVDDGPVGRPQIDRLADHAQRLVEVVAHVGPCIAEIVQHLRLIGRELQRHAEIGFRLRPLLHPLKADAAVVEQQPVGRLRGLDALDGGRIDLCRIGKLLVAAQHRAQRQHRREIVGIGRDHLFQMRARLVDPPERIEVEGDLDLALGIERRGGIERLVIADGLLGLVQPLEQLGQRNGGELVVGIEHQCQIEIGGGEFHRTFAADGGAQRGQRGRRPGARVGHDRRRAGALGDIRPQIVDHRAVVGQFGKTVDDLGRLLRLAGPHQSAGVGHHHPRQARVAGIGIRQPLHRRRVVAHQIGDEAAVIGGEGGEHLRIVQAVEGGEGLFHVLVGGIGPCHHERVGQFHQRAAAAHRKQLARFSGVAARKGLHRHRQPAEAVAVHRRAQLVGQRHGGGGVAARQRQREGAFHQHRVAGVVRQSGAVEPRGGGKILLLAGQPGGKIVARQRIEPAAGNRARRTGGRPLRKGTEIDRPACHHHRGRQQGAGQRQRQRTAAHRARRAGGANGAKKGLKGGRHGAGHERVPAEAAFRMATGGCRRKSQRLCRASHCTAVR